MRASVTCLAGGCLLLSAAALSTVPEAVDELSFDVLLDEERIGSHTFRISDSEGGRRVQTEAAFDVIILFVPVYSYRHNNTEVWRSGCLQQISSRTDSNGEQYAVPVAYPRPPAVEATLTMSPPPSR